LTCGAAELRDLEPHGPCGEPASKGDGLTGLDVEHSVLEAKRSLIGADRSAVPTDLAFEIAQPHELKQGAPREWLTSYLLRRRLRDLARRSERVSSVFGTTVNTANLATELAGHRTSIGRLLSRGTFGISGPGFGLSAANCSAAS